MIGLPGKNPYLDRSYLSLHGRVAAVKPVRHKHFIGLGALDTRPPVFSQNLQVISNRISEKRLFNLNQLIEEERVLRNQSAPGYIPRPALPNLSMVSKHSHH